MKRILLILLIPFMLTSCDPVKRAQRIVKKYPYTLQFICPSDTVLVIDTIITDHVIVDTVVVTTPWDTIIIEKDKLHVEIIRRVDTLLVTGECLPDTIYAEKVVYTPLKEVIVKRSPLPWILFGVLLVAGLFALFMYFTKRK